MGATLSSSSASADPVVRHLDFSVPQAQRTPLGALPANRPGNVALAFPKPPTHKPRPPPASFASPARPPPATPEATATAIKDEGVRRAALAQLRGDAVQKAVASQLAIAAGSSQLNLKQLKSLQTHAQAIAEAMRTVWDSSKD